MPVQPLLLGMDWMDPNWLLDRFDSQFFWISLLIVFIECGLFFPFLPGDTLLFALGLFISAEKVDLFPGGSAGEIAIAAVLLTGVGVPRQRRGLRDRPQDRPTDV